MHEVLASEGFDCVSRIDTSVFLYKASLCVVSHSAADGDVNNTENFNGMKSCLYLESKERLANECCDVLSKYVSIKSLEMHTVFVGDHLEAHEHQFTVRSG